MPQGLDDILGRLRARRAALAGPPQAPETEVLPAEGVDPNLDAILARIAARKKADLAPNAGSGPEIPAWRKYLAMVPRIGGSWLGALGAGALATPETLGAGTIPAAMAGGAAGGAAGEALAEWIEGRDKINPAQVAAQGAIGAVPMAKIFKGPLLPLLLKSGTAGAASAGLSESAETGSLPSARTLEQGFLLGGGVGAGLRGIERVIPGIGNLAAKMRGQNPAAAAEGEALTVDRTLNPGDFSPVEGPSTLGVGRPGTPPLPQRLPPSLRRLLPSQRTPTRTLESLPEGPEGKIELPEPSRRVPGRMPGDQRGATPLEGGPEGRVELPGPPQPPGRVPGRLPSDRLPSPIFETPEDTGLPVTGSVGGHPTLREGSPTQLPLADAPESFQTVEHDTAAVNNGSGESSASVEALNRQRSMQGSGKRYVVYDRAGARRELIGPDAVDYAARPGETYGIESPQGFQKLDDRGGNVPVKARIPAKITALWQDLKPRWAESVAKQAGDEIPFTVDPTEDLIPFAKRVMSEDPRTLMGAERKVRAALDAGEEGSASSELLTRLGLAAGGAAAGSALDSENRGRGAVGGLALGAGLPAILKNPALLEKLRYFSLLSSPATQAKNILGNVGAVGSRAAELALTGDTSKAGRILRETFSPETAEAARRSFTSPMHEVEAGRWGSTTGVTGIPGRIMGAMDESTKDALRRAGESSDSAATTTFTAEPKSAFGKGVTSFHGRGGPLARLIVPFARTATNLLERGVERTPGVGYLPAVRKMQGATMGEATARQALGALAGLLGYETGSDDPYLAAAAGPYALPYAMGAAGRKVTNRKGGKTTGSDLVRSAAGSVANATPLPRDAYAYDPAKILAQWVPNAASLMSEHAPNEFDTSGSLLNPSIAKIPMLNDLLLKLKSPRALAAQKRKKK